MIINLGKYLIYFASLISYYLFPPVLAELIKKQFSFFLSYRFARQIKFKNKIDIGLEYPFYVKGHQYITIGKGFRACSGFRIECWDSYAGEKYSPEIVIGENVSFNYRCHLGAIDRIVIGNNVLVGSQVLITDHGHGDTLPETLLLPPKKRKLYSKGPVIIEDNVWIGEGACIMANVRIGRNSVIGANSIVTKDVPPYSVVVGYNKLINGKSHI